MKRFTIFITLLVLSVMQMTAQDTSIKGTITLSHQGETTDFAYNQMASVMEAAVDGDTIYLSPGYFEGDFVIDKKVSFIGSGADSDNGWKNCTCYGSNNSNKIIVKLPENTKLSARLFEGIYFGDISFKYQTSIENVVFKKCRVYGYNYSIDAVIKSILFDKCYIHGDNFYTDNVKKAISRNCQIYGLNIWSSDGNDENNWQFINCTIDPSNYSYNDENGNYHNYCPIYRGSFVNCIIDNDENRDGIKNAGWLYNPSNTETKSSASFTNCLFYKPLEGREIFNGATVQNDMYFDASNLNDHQNNSIWGFSKEELLENYFLGNDGTVVGCYGGKNPYSLKQIQTTITSSKVHFDKDKKQIQIKLKVSSEL